MKQRDFGRRWAAWRAALSLLALTAVMPCQAQTSWYAHSAGTVKALNAVTFGAGLFVAAGDDSALLTSPDGAVWTARDPGTNRWLHGIGYGTNTFVAVGYAGALLTSSNAVDWIARDTGTSNFLCGVAHGNGVFVVVGQGGTILSSPDGETWTSRTSNTANDLEAVTFAHQMFVAVGYQGTVLYGSDGVVWQRAPVRLNYWLRGVTYGEGVFVAVGDAGTAAVSWDARFWYPLSTGTTNALFGVTHGELSGNRFFAVGEGGTVLGSVDGFEWFYQRESRTTNYLFSAGSGNGAVVLVGDAGVVVSTTPGTGPGGPLVLDDPRLLPDGNFQITITGVGVGQRVTIEWSETLLDWQPAGSVAGTGLPVHFVDWSAANSRYRAYRAWVP